MKNIRTEILRTQYQFYLRKLGKSSDIAFIDEREILPITEDGNPAGEGSFGEVYSFDIPGEYVDESLKYLQTNRFARKIFKRPTETEILKEFVLQQLKSERFQHHHLMPALAAFQHGADYFILFEFAQSTLFKLLNSDESIYNTQELWDQVRGLASGMAHLHKNSAASNGTISGSMLHRDIKPANILIVGRVMKIADFGFASYDISTTSGSRPTRASVHEGVSNYSSPPCAEVWKLTSYKFSRFSDTLRFQGILTGRRIYNFMSFELIEYALMNYPTSTLFNRKGKDKNSDMIGRGGHLQFWTRERPQARHAVWIIILSMGGLNVIKVVEHFAQKAQGLVKLDSPQPPNMVRLQLAQTHSMNLHNGIPLDFEPQRYENRDEVRFSFKDGKDSKSFWRVLEDLKSTFFAEEPPPVAVSHSKVAKSRGSLVMFRRDTAASHETVRSRESAGSRKGKAKERGDLTITTTPGHHLNI
ncbi:unnamed protein product [Diplocarpon coronariae]|nr:hypothetical protein JHW43_005531 [Diplocarpon mali]